VDPIADNKRDEAKETSDDLLGAKSRCGIHTKVTSPPQKKVKFSVLLADAVSASRNELSQTTVFFLV
jgi:hypothetical protein